MEKTAATMETNATTDYVTAMIGGQLFGLPIGRVQDVFMPERLTRVPLASHDIAGVLNLRGAIVTAIDIAGAADCPVTEKPDRRWRLASISAVSLMAS